MIKYAVIAFAAIWFVVWFSIVEWRRVRRAWRDGGWLSLMLLTFLGLMIANAFAPHRLPTASEPLLRAEPATVTLNDTGLEEVQPVGQWIVHRDHDDLVEDEMPLRNLEAAPEVDANEERGKETTEPAYSSDDSEAVLAEPDLPLKPLSASAEVAPPSEGREAEEDAPPLLAPEEEATPHSSARVVVDVAAPQRAYVHIPASYVVRVTNVGDDAAQDVSLVHHLPYGAKVLQASGEATQDAASREVRWKLPALLAGESTEVEVVVVYPEEGEYRPTFETDLGGDKTDSENLTFVESIPALTLELVDQADPVALGAEAVYEIVVANQGRSTATGVTVIVELPDGLTEVHVEGPGEHELRGRQLHLQPVSHLAPGKEVTYAIAGLPQAEGHQRVRVTLSADHLRKPVREEEDTAIYDPLGTGEATGD